MSILALHGELVRLIIGHLECDAPRHELLMRITSVSAVCKQWHEIIQDESLWKGLCHRSPVLRSICATRWKSLFQTLFS